MERAYRFLVTVYVEGDADTVPTAGELAEHIATQVQDEDNHNLSTCVRFIESEDYAEPNESGRTRGESSMRGKGRRSLCDDRYTDKDHSYRCTLPKHHKDRDHCMTTHPMHPTWRS